MTENYKGYPITEEVAEEVARRLEQYNDEVVEIIDVRSNGGWEVVFRVEEDNSGPLEPSAVERHKVGRSVKNLMKKGNMGKEIFEAVGVEKEN